ncbi:hypothetical protein Pcinc_026708 [Petrolisthes cinctipes]|uniref:Uncharacterized protein n=1 Tax=Petrolisthes cinctipes TaxID=88211 RepID=A0AAE1F5Y6_PETCI|nr:hypothetical protein Pcinc_026708 [Petrolisthes cinctipes]
MAFTLEDDTATVGQYLCSAYSLLTSAVQVNLDHPKRVYAAEQDVPYVESLVPTTPRTEVVELQIFDNVEKKKEKCSSNRAIGGLVLATGDNTRNTIHYFECRKYKYMEKMELTDPLVEVPTEEEKGSLSCPTNSVLMGFLAWNAQNEEIEIWNQPHKMTGQCKVLKKWSVDHGECQEMPVTNEPWWGEEHDDSNNWDNIVYCPRDSLAVALTRRLVDGYYRVVSLRCCYVSYP